VHTRVTLGVLLLRFEVESDDSSDGLWDIPLGLQKGMA
jgi:hypothetical protein